MKIQTFLLLLLLLSSFLQIYDVRKTWSNEQRISVFFPLKKGKTIARPLLVIRIIQGNSGNCEVMYKTKLVIHIHF